MNWAQLNEKFDDLCQSTSSILTEKDTSRIRAIIWQNFDNGRFSPEQLKGDATIINLCQAIIANYLTSASSLQLLQIDRDKQAWESLKEWVVPLIKSCFDGVSVTDGRVAAVWHNVSVTILQTEFDYLQSLTEWVTHLVTQTIEAAQLFSPKPVSEAGLLDGIRQLPILAQKILLMNYVDNLSLGEIANQLALPLSVVIKTHLLAHEALNNKVTATFE